MLCSQSSVKGRQFWLELIRSPQLTPITHHIPFFLREPAEALIGEQCYTSLVYNVHLTDVECLKYALSKGLGLGIVLGGAIVKIPQVRTVHRVRAQS